MEKNALRKLIRDELDPVLLQNGFLHLAKSLCYYKVQDDVLCFILFNKKSYGYECGMYIQPLYIPNSTIVLNLGNTLEYIEHQQRKCFTLWNDFSKSEIESNLKNVSLYLQEKGESWFQKIGSPRGISQNILNPAEIGQYISSPEVWIYEAKAYSDLYLGDYKQAQLFFEKFIKTLKESNTGEWVLEQEKTVSYLLDAMHHTPTDIYKILREYVKKTRECIKI